jgi:hypothetical protein
MDEYMLEISSEEKEILKSEVEILSNNTFVDAKTRTEFSGLLIAINEQKIDDSQLPVLTYVLELLLTTGEIRKQYSPIEEHKILRLYNKTPAGKERKDNIDELNRSLKALNGQNIESISFSVKMPGVYGISITTDKCELSLNANQSGIYADKLEIEI